ncbi:MAG: hypothetical protein ABI867_34435 [Kofleriaceae bacterium]
MRLSTLSIVALALLIGAAGRVRAECLPAAVPTGDPVLVQRLADQLTASGIATTASEGCPVVRVQVEKRGQLLVLRVTDGFQRRGERSVQDVGTAAAVIESWTLQEIELRSTPAAPAPAAQVIDTALVTAAWLTVAVSGRSAIQNDGSAWLGGALTGCVRVRWTCVGASVAYAANASTTNDHTRGSQRSAELDALATVDVPVRLGRFTLSPGFGIGYGWQTFAQQHTDAQMLPFSIELASHALRGGAHVVLSRPLGPIAVFAELFGDASLARTEISNPTTAPRARAGLSLGLRLEMP